MRITVSVRVRHRSLLSELRRRSVLAGVTEVGVPRPGGTTLYVQRSACSSIGPLICSGTMWPHMPTPAVQTPFGAGCPACSSVGTGFTCPRCMTAQLFLMPGTQPSALYGREQPYAPVVKASPNASESKLKSLFEALTPLAREFGSAFGQAAFGQNSSGGGSPWQQSAGYQW